MRLAWVRPEKWLTAPWLKLSHAATANCAESYGRQPRALEEVSGEQLASSSVQRGEVGKEPVWQGRGGDRVTTVEGREVEPGNAGVRAEEVSESLKLNIARCKCR